jgi:hypothetical protein
LISDPFGRNRKRRRWLLPLAAIFVVIAAIGLSQAATPSSPLIAEDVRSRAMQVSRRADVFRDMLVRMGSVNRVELTTVTEEALSRIAGARTFLAELEDAPGEIAGVVALFDLALVSWAEGTQGLTEHLLAAADGDPSLGLGDLILDDLLELRAGDRLYLQAVAALAAADVTQPVSPMPDIRFLPEGYPIVPGARTLLAQAQVEGSLLALNASLTLEQVTTVPDWVLDTEGSLVLDASEELVVRVIVTNSGNAGSDPMTLVIEVVGGDGSAQAASAPVPVLAAGAKTTVTFDPLAVTPGRSYSLVVRLEGELGLVADSRTLLFRVNEGTVVNTSTTEGG